MLDFAICASTNLFRMYLIDRFVTAFLGRLTKNRDRGTELLVYACFYITNTAFFWEYHTIWINILCNLTGIGVIVWLHTRSAKTILFVTCSIYLINMGCDVATMFPFVSYENGVVNDQIYAVLSVFLILICELITEKIVITRKNTEIPLNFPLVFIPLCSIALIFLLTNTNFCTENGIAIVCIGMLLLNFSTLYLYNLLLHSISQKYETEMLQQKVQIYANQLDVILQSEEKLKALKHDMKHHMNELKLLANKHGVTEIQEYIDHMENYIRNPNELVASGNMEIDSVLNYMLQKAQEELKDVSIKVALPEKIKHSFDVNIMLGNLLENAIEAARQTEKRYLGIDITLKKGVLKIKVANSFSPDNLSPSFLTTKKAKEQHGIGLKNVRKIVEKYNGAMEVTSQNDIFCVNLILYMTNINNTESEI